MDNQYNKEFAIRLGEIADELYDGNKSELARGLDFQPGAFYKYLSGATLPGTLILSKIRALGISIDWLLSGDGKMMLKGPKYENPFEDPEAERTWADIVVDLHRLEELILEAGQENVKHSTKPNIGYLRFSDPVEIKRNMQATIRQVDLVDKILLHLKSFKDISK